MENNMKQFNLQEYLAHPERKVVTRDGRKVTRFLCTDAKTDFPIIALLEATPGSNNEILCAFKKNGSYFGDVSSNCDLFFAPTKHTDYINLYRNGDSYFLGGGVYTSEENAKYIANGDNQYIKTIKVEWEE